VGDSREGSPGKEQGPAKTNGKNGKKVPKAGPEPPSQGRYVSVYDYFQQSKYFILPQTITNNEFLTPATGYSIAVRDPRLPVVNVGSHKDPIYLPAQVCEILPGRASNVKLSAAQAQTMIRSAVRKPAQNAQSIITSGAQILGMGPSNVTLVRSP
jgi:hypothetical protein